MDQIASRLPEKLQMLVFSATIPEKLRPFLKKYLENPLIEEIRPKAVISESIENWLISTKGKDKNQLVYQLLTTGHPYLAIVFANTKSRVDELTDYLKEKRAESSQDPWRYHTARTQTCDASGSKFRVSICSRN